MPPSLPPTTDARTFHAPKARLFASLLRADGRESIEIDNIIGQDELRRRMEAGDYVHGRFYEIGGKKFDFTPHDFGPYDKAVYSAVDELAERKLMRFASRRSRYRTYALTPEGLAKGKELAKTLPSDIEEYIRDVVKWLLRSDFDKIVKVIYQEYPGMKRHNTYRPSAE